MQKFEEKIKSESSTFGANSFRPETNTDQGIIYGENLDARGRPRITGSV
jgi:hypothetical protein